MATTRKAQSGTTGVYRVTLTEHERGWGAKSFHHEDFSDKEKALAYMRKENAKNTAPTAPDYYICAEEPRFVPKGKPCDCIEKCKGK